MWSSRERPAFGLFWSSSSAGRLGRGHRQRHGTALPLGWPSRERPPSTARHSTALPLGWPSRERSPSTAQHGAAARLAVSGEATVNGTARRCRCPMWSMHERTSRRWPGPPGVTLQVTSGGSRRPVPGLGVVADVDLHRQVRCVRVPRHVQAVTAGARDPPASAGCWSTHTALDRPACHPARRCTSAAPRCGSGRRGRGNPALEHAAGARHLHDRHAVSVRLIVWREAFLVDDEIVDGPLIGFSDPIRLLREFLARFEKHGPWMVCRSVVGGARTGLPVPTARGPGWGVVHGARTPRWTGRHAAGRDWRRAWGLTGCVRGWVSGAVDGPAGCSFSRCAAVLTAGRTG